MKTLVTCPSCAKNRLSLLYYVEVDDKGVGELQCSRGHSWLVINQAQKFERLFDSGALAYLDGYYREAIVNFAAGIERAYEFAVRVLLRHAEVRSEAVDEAWKSVAAQSERQLGAYIMLYLRELGVVPPLPPPWSVTLRNKTVHKGFFPPQEQSHKYGSMAHELVTELLRSLKKSCPTAVQSEAQEVTLRAAKPHPGRTPLISLPLGVLNFWSGKADLGTESFDDALDRLRVMRTPPPGVHPKPDSGSP